MKVILAGSSGFIGQEVLHQALQNPSITSLIALSRRPLPTTDPKLKTLLLDDFTSYSPAVLAELSGAESCIWTLGVKRVDAATARKVSLDYTLAAADAFSQLGAAGARPFRFVFASGVLAVREQESSVWFFGEARKIKGLGEKALLDCSKANAASLDGYVVRPAAVLAKSGGLASIAAAALPAVKVDVLAAAMVDLALHGGEEKILENRDLVRLGREKLQEGN